MLVLMLLANAMLTASEQTTLDGSNFPIPEPLEVVSGELTRSYDPAVAFPRPGDPLKHSLSARQTVQFGAMEIVANFGFLQRPAGVSFVNLSCVLAGMYLPVRGRAETWNQIMIVSSYAGCKCRRSHQPRVTSSPDHRLLVFYGFGPGQACANQVLLYHGDWAIQLNSRGGEHVPWAFYPGLVAVPVSHEQFDLISYGGALCDDLDKIECLTFSDDVWQLRISSNGSSRSGSEAAEVWTRRKVVVHSQRSGPGPRSNPYLFRIGNNSLLLFGGVQVTANYTRLLVKSDFWTYTMDRGHWQQLHTDLAATDAYSVPVTANSFRLLYNSLQAVYVKDYNVIVVAVHDPFESIDLFICELPEDETHKPGMVYCRKAGTCQTHVSKAVRSLLHISWFSLTAGDYSVYMLLHGRVRVADLSEFTIRRVTSSSGKTSLALLQDQQQDLRMLFPGFQESFSAAPVIKIDNFLGITEYAFLGGYRMGNDGLLSLVTPDLPLKMEVWGMRMNRGSGMSTISMKASPSAPPYARLYGHTATRVGAVAILFGGERPIATISSTLVYESHPWCYHLGNNYWRRAKYVPFLQATPRARSLHVSFPYRDIGMAVQGGASDLELFGDLWMFVTSSSAACSGRWVELTGYVTGGHLPRRKGHSATQYGDWDVILFGGYSSESKGQKNGLESNTEDAKDDMYLTILRIISLTEVRIRKIPLQRSVQRRTGHSLSRYTNDSFLLLGGVHRVNMGNFTVAHEALLLQMRPDNTMKIIPFFNYSIMQHHVVDNLVVSGLALDGIGSRFTQLNYLLLKNDKHCPVGYGRNAQDSCQPCPKGTYASSVPQQCTKCAEHLTTAGEGASVCIAKDPCTTNTCHGHGACFVDSENDAYCKCRFGYLPADDCRTPTVYLSQIAAAVFSTVLAILITSLVKYLRRGKTLRRTEEELRVERFHLHKSKLKLSEINRGTRVRWVDLTITRQIASGTISKVYLAELNDLVVVVKKLPRYATRAKWQVDLRPYDIFMEEAEALRSLRHPNIVLFLGAGQDAASIGPFLVMEYLRRGSLYDNLKDRAVDIDGNDRLRFAMDIGRGMRYLHSSNPPQIHRDLKSPNILVSEKWVLKIADLEFVRYSSLVKEDDKTTRTSTGARSCPGDQSQSDANQSTPSGADSLGTALAPTHAGSSTMLTPLLPCVEESAERQAPGLNSSPSSHHCTPSELIPTHDVPVAMTCGVGTDRWRAPETLTKNSYTEKSDVYR